MRPGKHHRIRDAARSGHASRRAGRPRRLRATFVAALAIAAALAGTALAGSEQTAGTAGKLDQTLKNAKQAKSKAKQATKVADGVNAATGTQGEKGEPGTQGPKGAQGQPGADAASAYTAKITIPGGGATHYGAVSGLSAGTGAFADFYMLSPNYEIEVSDLAVEVSGPPGGGNGYTFTILDDGAPGVACSIDGSNKRCDSAGATDTIAAGSLLVIHIFKTETPPGASAWIGFRATTP